MGNKGRMKYIEFGGGIGDMINDIYRYDGYSSLQGMPTGSYAKVGLITHNPHAKELFQFWPGGHLLEVHDYGYWSPEEDAGYRAANAMPPKPKNVPRPEWAVFSFHNHPADEVVLRELPDEYIVFSVSAGTSDRNIPPLTLECIDFIAEYEDAPPAVFVGREYERAGKGEIIPSTERLSFINRLSLPATFNVVKDPRCKGVVACHSAISLLAGWENKPQLLLYDEATQRRHFQKKDQWSWYVFDRQNVFHGTFDQWQDRAEQFFNHIQCSTVTT